jgi:hypothetical protein
MKHTYLGSLASFFAAGSLLLGIGAGPAAVARDAAPAPAGSAALLGGALPGGAVISARSVALAPVSGGATTGTPIAGDGTFRAVGLQPGAYRLAVTSVTVPKQTQGATFGEKVNAGLHAAGSALAQGASLAGGSLPATSKHDTAKNSVGNIRASEVAAPPATPTGSAAQAASLSGLNGGMPNRISMNVTVGKRTQQVAVDDTAIDVDVGQDGILSGRVAAN